MCLFVKDSKVIYGLYSLYTRHESQYTFDYCFGVQKLIVFGRTDGS